MTISGTFTNGVVVLDQNPSLPEGTRVQVVVETSGRPAEPSIGASLLELAGQVENLPSDMARNHDHYLHGAPRK